MSFCCKDYLLVMNLLIVSCISLSVYATSHSLGLPNEISADDSHILNTTCPPWLDHGEGNCECKKFKHDLFACEGNGDVSVLLGECLTWDEGINKAVIGDCPYFSRDIPKVCKSFQYIIPANVSNSNLSNFVCSKFNRQGRHCKECIHGHGPAPFLNGANIPCAQCYERNYIWIFYLLLQLLMVTIIFLSFLLSEYQGTSSPFNVFSYFYQIVINSISSNGTLYASVMCEMKLPALTVLLTVGAFWNLDFFRYSLPSVCVSPSMSNIHALLFEYIIAFYPIFLTLVSFFCIKLHGRGFRLVIYAWKPFHYLFTSCKGTHQWNPMKSVLNTFANFLLLSYSKILFTSVNLLYGVKLYDNDEKEVKDSPILLYDSSLKYFGRSHTPYVCLSLVIILIFIIIPPSLLLLYPTKCFKLCLEKCGFKRWHALAIVMDVFQGWYKDGTNGTRDYRALSALYMILRIGFASEFILVLMFQYQTRYNSFEWSLPSLIHIGLGCFFLTVKPYKKTWMSTIDGLVLILLGMSTIMVTIQDMYTLALVGVLVMIPTVVAVCYGTKKCYQLICRHLRCCDTSSTESVEFLEQMNAARRFDSSASDGYRNSPLLTCSPNQQHSHSAMVHRSKPPVFQEMKSGKSISNSSPYGTFS